MIPYATPKQQVLFDTVVDYSTYITPIEEHDNAKWLHFEYGGTPCVWQRDTGRIVSEVSDTGETSTP